MAIYTIKEETLTDIANAIREKTGKTETIKPINMANEIMTIETSNNDLADAIISRTITEYSNPNLTTLGDYTFYQCKSFTSLNCPNLTKIGKYALSETGMTVLDLPLVKEAGENAFAPTMSGTRQGFISVNLPLLSKIGSYAFRYNNNLEEITLPSLKTTNTTFRVFQNCSKLKRADLGPVVQLYSYWFANTSISTLILRGSTVAQLYNINVFDDTPIKSGTGYIYVPKDLEETYKTTTNWATYANQIRAIEDYPDICGG